jgi:uncharacterized protein (TIGR00299 family) protein
MVKSMRIAYLDCFAGIAGDMFLGALLDAGVPVAVLEEATAALGIGASLRTETVDRSGISAIKVHVLEHGQPAEVPAQTAPLQQQSPEPHTHQPKTQHLHKAGHTHDHPHSHSHDPAGHSTEPQHESSSPAHSHSHGRSLSEIRSLIQAASLPDPVKQTAIRAFELLGASEAKIHNVPVERIHFHEVGAVDAIVDIVAASAGIHHLQIQKWHCSPLNVGGGMVSCAHGTFPVPAPATADLLRGLPTYSAHVQKELVTPTGAALVRALAPSFGTQPAMRIEHIGYGAGTRNPASFPNVLRLSIGESVEPTSQPDPGSELNCDTVTVLETALDDCSPQLLAYVAEKALALGALDVMLTPVLMKKGRPGTLVTVLARPAFSDPVAQLLLRETTTLGLRIRHDRRMILDRTTITVSTQYGAIRLKCASDPGSGQTRNLAPEYEDCRAAAEQHNVPLKLVQQAAIQAASSEIIAGVDPAPPVSLAL